VGVGTYSSLTVSSSFVGRRGRTNVNSEEERSVRNRRCRTPGCIVVDCDCGMVWCWNAILRYGRYTMRCTCSGGRN
jgi:hypothetical protein